MTTESRSVAHPLSDDATSAIVARLDRLLNHRIITAPSAEECRKWWTIKVEAKRHLELLPEDCVRWAAAYLLGRLTRREVRAA